MRRHHMCGMDDSDARQAPRQHVVQWFQLTVAIPIVQTSAMGGGQVLAAPCGTTLS